VAAPLQAAAPSAPAPPLSAAASFAPPTPPTGAGGAGAGADAGPVSQQADGGDDDDEDDGGGVGRPVGEDESLALMSAVGFDGPGQREERRTAWPNKRSISKNKPTSVKISRRGKQPGDGDDEGDDDDDDDGDDRK